MRKTRRGAGRQICRAMVAFVLTFEILVANASLDQDMAALSADTSWKETEKRNTWWSKRATPQGTVSVGFEQEIPLCALAVSAVGCYVDTCVTNLFECGRAAERKSSFGQCKENHRNCLANCVRGAGKLSTALLK
ncbi:unnamed protein product [Ixodes pacificus]